MIPFRPNGPSFCLNRTTIRPKRYLFEQKLTYLKLSSYYLPVPYRFYTMVFITFTATSIFAQQPLLELCDRYHSYRDINGAR